MITVGLHMPHFGPLARREVLARSIDLVDLFDRSVDRYFARVRTVAELLELRDGETDVLD